MTLGDELLVTLWALEWPLTSMRAHMSFQVSGLRKLLKALFKRTDQNLLFFFGSLDFFDLGYIKRGLVIKFLVTTIGIIGFFSPI